MWLSSVIESRLSNCKQFDWKRVFQIIGKSLYDMAKSASQSNFGDLLGPRKMESSSGRLRPIKLGQRPT